MYPRNHINSSPPEEQRRTSAPPRQIVYAMPSKNNPGALEWQRPSISLPIEVHPSSPYYYPPQQTQQPKQTWYYVGPKGTSTNHFGNIPHPASTAVMAPYTSTNSSLVYPQSQQQWHYPPIYSNHGNLHFHHPTAATAIYPQSIESVPTMPMSNSEKKKGSSNCIVVSLSVSIIVLLLCFAGIITIIVTQPSFLQLQSSIGYSTPSEPQKQQKTSSQTEPSLSQQSVKASLSPSTQTNTLPSDNLVPLAHSQDDDVFVAFKTAPTQAPRAPIVRPTSSGSIPTAVADYSEFIQAFSTPMSSSTPAKTNFSTLKTTPSPSPVVGTSAPSSTTVVNTATVTNAAQVPVKSPSLNSNSGSSSSLGKREPSPSPIKKPLDSKNNSSVKTLLPAPAPLTSSHKPTTKDGYYYYYYTQKPVKTKDKHKAQSSTSNSTNIKSTNSTTGSSSSATTDITAILSSQQLSSSSDDDIPVASILGSSSTNRDSSSSKKDTTANTSAKVTAQPTPSPSVQKLPGFLLGAIDDDDDHVSVYGNANTTIPCDLLMCDDNTDDDGGDTSSSNGVSSNVIYSKSDDGVLPSSTGTITMTSGSTDDTTSPLEAIVGVPITQSNSALSQDDGFPCSSC